MSDAFPLYVIIGVGTGLGALALIEVIKSRRKRDSENYPYLYGNFDVTPLPVHKGKVHMFCRDCGKGMVSMRSQDGFSTITGTPVYSYARACADASSGHVAWPFCGTRTRQAHMANAHNHPDPTETSLACPVCLDVMTQNAGIDQKQAIELYLKTGVTSSESHPDGWGGLAGGSLAKLFMPPPPPVHPAPPTPPRRRSSSKP